MKRKELSYSLSCSLILLLSSCSSLRQSVKPPEIQIPQSFVAAATPVTAESTGLLSFSESSLSIRWWEEFGDKRLNEFVERVLLHNDSYQIALHNYEIAKSYLDEASASKWPLFALNYGLSRNRLSQTPTPIKSYYNSQQLSGSVSYEIDFWNRVGNSVAEAQANLSASDADREILKLSLISQCVSTYWQILGFDLALENLYAQQELTGQSVKLNQIQLMAQLINAEPVELALIQLEQIGTAIQSTIKAREIALYTLAYLAGEYPENFQFEKSHAWPPRPVAEWVPAGLPSKLLTARPDIQQAYWQVISAGYAQKQSLASYFPTLMLTGNYGFSSTQLTQLLSSNSLAGSIGVGLFQPLLNYGAIDAQYERSKLQYEAAFLAYSDCVKSAFQEVNQALITYKSDYESLQSHKRQLMSSLELYSVATAKEQAGLLDGISYLNYELNLLQLEYEWIGQRVVLIQDIVQLYKVLGLGFNEAASLTPLDTVTSN